MESNRFRLFLAISNIVGFLGTVVVNALANILPIAGKNTGQLSDQYPNLFVPARLTFSIWGVIYILLAIFVVYGLVSALKKDGDETGLLGKAGIFFFVSCLANIGWIYAWHYEIVPLSLVLMLVLLGCLLTIYLRLGVGISEAPAAERYMVHLPFSVYLGWITIATIANVTALLVDIGWNGFGLSDQFWAVIVIIIGIVITVSMLLTRKDIYYSLVVDWALLGILIKRLADNTAPDAAVVSISITGMVIVTVGILMQLVRRQAY